MQLDNYLEIYLLLATVALGLVKWKLHVRWGRPVAAMLLVSLALGYSQYFSSDYRAYTNDIGGHVEYITVIAKTGTLPPPLGWQTQQPPLYYVIAAGFYKVGEWLNLQEPVYAARFFSLLLYTGFLVLSLLTLRQYLAGWYFIMASAIVLFWPDGITYPGRTSNDVGMLFSHALTFYLATRWHCGKYKQPRWLLYACFSAFIGMLIKSSGIIGLGAVAMMVAVALYKKQISYRLFFNKALLATAVLSLGINFGRIAYYKWVKGANIFWFENVDGNHLPSGWQRPGVPYNLPFNYIHFDLMSFLRDPFFWSVPNGSPFFWNAFLKSLLFGEWGWHAGPVAAGIVSAMLVVILFYVITYILLKARPTLADLCFPALIFMICMIGALAASRVQIPWAAQCNGRYVFGVIVMFALFFTKAVEWHRKEGRVVLAALGIGSALAFNITSIIMMVSEFYGRL